MRLNDLSSHPSEWFGTGPSAEIVISSRVRLARNLAGFKFLSACSNEDKQNIATILRDNLLAIDMPQERSYYNVDTASTLDRDFLVERHLISHNLAHGKGPRGVVIAGQEAFTAMINEEDHLRLQVIKGGLQLQQCWEEINHIDDLLERKVEYAFNPKYGYLTACPTNVGTGIRVSVMLHLPALKMTNQTEKFFNATRDMDMAVRGLFGEGTEAIGDFYQISNQVTLGISEAAIVNDFTNEIVPKIVEYELAARQQLLAKETSILNDRIHRALGILKSAYMISSQEALGLLSHLRMGVNMKKLEGVSIPTINELFLLTQPAHLQLNEGRTLDANARDELRAKILRQHLN